MKTISKAKSGDLRETLKVLMERELEQLPEMLKALEPKERINFITKLMPYVLTVKEQSIWDGLD